MKIGQSKLWSVCLTGIITICLIVIIVYYSIVVQTTVEISELRHEHFKFKAAPLAQPQLETKFILLWTKMFDQRNWYLAPNDIQALGEDFFSSLSCPYTNCIITANKNHLDSVDKYDAILFHGVDVNSYDIPRTRSVYQKYVFGMMESPSYSRHNLKDFNKNFFNWTMTYRLDADVPWFYMSVLDIETNRIIAPNADPHWKPFEKDFKDENFMEIIKGKSKMIAWFVSNCRTHAKRENLTQDIQRYLPVDIYGKCGPLRCGRDNDSCETMLTNDYKFYLSFENSLCQDYVTEKLFSNLQQTVIPIVYGGADYAKFAPPYSYINTSDFETVEDLVKYLYFLSDHPEEYMKYFWWKKYYKIGDHVKHGFCNLCTKLNEPSSVWKSESYTNLENWWGTCTDMSRIKFL